MIPDAQTLMLPVLRVASHGEIWVVQAKELLAEEFGMSEADKRLRAPGAEITRFSQAFEQAVAALERDGLLQTTRRGFYETTEQGMQALAEGELPQATAAPVTPKPRPMDDYEERGRFVLVLLERLCETEMVVFKQLVAQVLQALGYDPDRSPTALFKVMDGTTAQGTIAVDRLGAVRAEVRMLRGPMDETVEEDQVVLVAAAMQASAAAGGILITTSRLTRKAVTAAEMARPPIVTIDGRKLARLMIQHEIGCVATDGPELWRLDEDAFKP